MCRDGFRETCRGCGRTVTCRDDYPYCEAPCWFGHGMTDREAAKIMSEARSS